MTSWRSLGPKAPLSGEFPVSPPPSLVASAAEEAWAAQGVLCILSLPCPPPRWLVLNAGVFASHHNEKSLHDFEAELHFYRGFHI